MKKFIVLLISLYSINLQGQTNLVLNPSFEDTLNCDDNLYFLEDLIPYWYWGKGYYNICRSSDFWVPNNISGHQYPHTGNAYSGIYTFAKSSSPPLALRNYILTKLSQNLIAGKKYKVAFYVSLGDTMHASNNTIGAHFAPDSLFSFSNGIITEIPQIQNNNDNDLSSKTNWTLVCDTFVATGLELWMIIGNFQTDSLSAISVLDSICSIPLSFNCASYYYIDDVSVTLIDETGFEEQKLKNYSLFPNPNNGTFELLTSSNNPITCEISDMAGRIITNGYYKPVGNMVLFSLGNLTKGVYHLKVIDNIKVTFIKIVIN